MEMFPFFLWIILSVCHYSIVKYNYLFCWRIVYYSKRTVFGFCRCSSIAESTVKVLPPPYESAEKWKSEETWPICCKTITQRVHYLFFLTVPTETHQSANLKLLISFFFYFPPFIMQVLMINNLMINTYFALSLQVWTLECSIICLIIYIQMKTPHFSLIQVSFKIWFNCERLIYFSCCTVLSTGLINVSLTCIPILGCQAYSSQGELVSKWMSLTNNTEMPEGSVCCLLFVQYGASKSHDSLHFNQHYLTLPSAEIVMFYFRYYCLNAYLSVTFYI